MICKTEEASMKPKKLFFKLALFIPLALLAMSAVVMWLWNWLLPALFAGVASITLLQAVGLLALSRILFGGFRGHGGWHRHHGHGPWQRLAGMSDDERQAWRERMGGRCGGGKA